MEINSYSDIPRDPKELVEFLAIVHLGIAANEDNRISSGSSAIYMGSEKAFKTAILFAYPKLSNERIYEVWLDCNESIAYCVDQIEKEIAAENEFRRLCALEGAAYESAYEMGKTCAELFYKQNIGSRTAHVRVPEKFEEVATDYVESYREGWHAYELEVMRAVNKGE